MFFVSQDNVCNKLDDVATATNETLLSIFTVDKIGSRPNIKNITLVNFNFVRLQCAVRLQQWLAIFLLCLCNEGLIWGDFAKMMNNGSNFSHFLSTFSVYLMGLFFNLFSVFFKLGIQFQQLI